MSETLNLGAGTDTRPGAHNVDVEPLAGIDEVVDLDDRPWPWADGRFSRVLAHHVLEHLADPVGAMSEIARVTDDDGTLSLVYPIGHTRFEDPTHRQYWNYNTAAALVGERKHGHETASPFELVQRRVEYTVGSRPWRAYARLKERVSGPGPWLSQVPTLYGHVHARYRKL